MNRNKPTEDADLYIFDLHIRVGRRTWPDDVETYCEVTFPGLDDAHPIHRNYLSLVLNDSLDKAIELAARDIADYMHDPETWIAQYLRERGSVAEKRRQLELWIQENEADIASYRRVIATREESLAKIRRRMQELEGK